MKFNKPGLRLRPGAARSGVDQQRAAQLIAADKKRLWHPFTQMQEWCAADHEPLIITRGEGVWLWDQHERRYFDGNSSIWTNIHGHNHPRINAAMERQLKSLAHSSFLGFTNEPAIHLAEALVAQFPENSLTRVFYSDDGSTAMECAIKMALQYWQLQGRPDKCEFLAFDQAYHGDTLGAAALGGIATFHGRFQHLGFRVHHVCDANALAEIPEDLICRLAGVVIEPLVQGAAGIKLWPPGMLRQLRTWCDWHDVFLLFDEVLTGFGRTGTLFACQQDGVTPDFIALAKGLTGGYLPLAATLATEKVFSAFLGRHDELKTFFYGHSYTGNPLGCAAALESLRLFEDERTLENVSVRSEQLAGLLSNLKRTHPLHVGDIRQAGLIAGIDILADAPAAKPHPWQAQTGAKVCLAARAHGLLTRPIRDTLVLMPPLCVTNDEIAFAMNAIDLALRDALQ